MTVAPVPSAPADLELIAQLKSRLRYAELRIRVLEEVYLKMFLQQSKDLLPARLTPLI